MIDRRGLPRIDGYGNPLGRESVYDNQLGVITERLLFPCGCSAVWIKIANCWRFDYDRASCPDLQHDPRPDLQQRISFKLDASGMTAVADR
jgi:hypothetical protein